MLFSNILTAAVLSATVQAAIPDSDANLITALKSQNFSTTLGSTCACTILNAIFPGHAKVLFPNSTAYTTEATHYWDLRSDLSPSCVFVPASAGDVAKGVVILRTCQSQFAIRGGGHMPIPGAANTDGGVLVAMTNLNEVAISTDLSTVSAGAGLGWISVYSALEKYGLYAIGGRYKSIGVAGLTLGGGLNYFAAKYGFTMDNVVSFEVVIASGDIVNASATEKPDLFWALKGSGSNFGVVTKFTYSTVFVPQVSTAVIIYTEDSVPAFIDAIAAQANGGQEASGDLMAGAINNLNYVPATGSMSPTFIGVQNGSVVSPPVFKNYTDIPGRIYSAFNVSTPAYWHNTLDTPYQVDRRLFGMKSMLPDAATMLEMYTTFKAQSDAIASIEGLTTGLVFQIITKSTTSVAANNGIGNAMEPDNTKSYIWWQLNAFWANAADDEFMIDWSETLLNQLHASNAAKGLAVDTLYMGDCGDSQKPFEGYKAGNVDKLKNIRTKYDPSLVFRNLCSGGFKLD